MATTPLEMRRRSWRSLLRKLRPLFGLLVLLAFNAGPVDAAVFMRWEGVPGESTDADHEGWIELTSFNQNNHVVDPGLVGSGQFTKPLDRSSPKIAEALARGLVIPELEVEFVRTEGEVHRLFRMLLRDVEIYSYFLHDAGGPQSTEFVGFLFKWAEWTYVEMDGSGRPLANHKAHWDFLRNEGGGGTERLGFVVRATQVPGEALEMEWEAEEGRVYQLMGTMDLSEPFRLIQEIPAGDAGMRSLEPPSVGRFGFYYLTEQPE